MLTDPALNSRSGVWCSLPAVCKMCKNDSLDTGFETWLTAAASGMSSSSSSWSSSLSSSTSLPSSSPSSSDGPSLASSFILVRWGNKPGSSSALRFDGITSESGYPRILVLIVATWKLLNLCGTSFSKKSVRSALLHFKKTCNWWSWRMPTRAKIGSKYSIPAKNFLNLIRRDSGMDGRNPQPKQAIG